jgi:hypothetical protein
MSINDGQNADILWTSGVPSWDCSSIGAGEIEWIVRGSRQISYFRPHRVDSRDFARLLNPVYIANLDEILASVLGISFPEDFFLTAGVDHPLGSKLDRELCNIRKNPGRLSFITFDSFKICIGPIIAPQLRKMRSFPKDARTLQQQQYVRPWVFPRRICRG